MKSKEEVKKKRFACIGTVAFARKVNVTMCILLKTVIFICRGRYEGIAHVETCRDRQGHKRTDEETRTSRDKQGQAWTDRDKYGKAGTKREYPCLSLLVPVCPCLVPVCPCFVPACPCLSLLVPALSLALTGIIGK